MPPGGAIAPAALGTERAAVSEASPGSVGVPIIVSFIALVPVTSPGGNDMPGRNVN